MIGQGLPPVPASLSAKNGRGDEGNFTGRGNRDQQGEPDRILGEAMERDASCHEYKSVSTIYS